MWKLLDCFVEDMDRFSNQYYDLSLESFNTFVTQTVTNATRMYFNILSEAEYHALPSNSKSVFIKLVQAMCSLAGRTAQVRSKSGVLRHSNL